MHEAQTWRDLLRIIIGDSKEKQRLVDELGITPITLIRWINGESEPRPQNLRRLITLLPQHREQFRTLIREEKGMSNFASTIYEEFAREIPSEFYSRIMIARASTSENLRFWSTCHLILQQAMGQLDPDRQGISIWVVRCMPPSGPYHKVRSLRESIGLGTYPWSGNLEQTAMFLGAESLAGHVVTLCRPGVLQNIDEKNAFLPAARVEFEKSAAVYPILYAGRIGGVLLISSTQPNYFNLSIKTELVQRYADLTALAFEPEDFYAPEQIALSVMPSHEEQKTYFANFRKLVAETMQRASTNKQPLNNIQADLLVWQKLEEELLCLPIQKNMR
jgi:hypothetical protein